MSRKIFFAYSLTVIVGLTFCAAVSSPSFDGLDYLTPHVEAGKTYRVEGEILWGCPAGRPKFAGVSESGIATPAAA